MTTTLKKIARNTQLRILYMNPNADLYGASRVLLRLIESLDRETCEIWVVMPEEGPLAAALREQRVHVRIIPYLSVIRRRVFRSWRTISFSLSIIPSIVRLWWLLKRNRIDLVHTNTGVVFTSAIAAWLAGIPHIWHIHEMFAEEFPQLWRYFGPFMLRFSDRIICVSRQIARQFEPQPKVQVVYNGVDMATFTASPDEIQRMRQAYCSQHYTKLVGIVGRISPRKGQTVFLEACASLKAAGYDTIRFLIVGDTFAGNEYLMDYLQTFVQEHGMVDDVVFVGFIENPVSLIAALDIVVLPSILPEAFPTIVLEAMALGVPVIATDLGGTIEQIENGVSGLLIPACDPAVLSQAVQKLLDNPALGNQLGQAGQKRVETNFTMEKMCCQMQDIYAGLA